MKIHHIKTPRDCTGCALCSNVCSKNAIRMVWSAEGFLIPEVDEALCVECGLCTKQCIALEEKTSYTDDIDGIISYGGWNKNADIHRKSSSGGIFTALAEQVINEGGIVFGVVWKDKHTAVFDKTETIEGLKLMRGSKYTPAVPGMVYRQVRDELKAGRKVLFSGTPCQVHALKKYLRKPYNTLITIDIVCHGMPSHRILEQYIKEDEHKSGKIIDYVSFRDKPEGWLKFHVVRHYTDGSEASEALTTDMYMRLFLSDKALNYVCYNCPYAHIPRQGDITLGDYWGAQIRHSDWPIDKGISAILANSKQGSEALASINDKISLLKEPFSNIYAGQGVVYIRPPKKVPVQRNLVLSKLGKLELKKVYGEFVQAAYLGPFRLKKSSLVYKILDSLIRIARNIKKIIKRPIKKS